MQSPDVVVVGSVCAPADCIAELPSDTVGMTDNDSKNPVAIIIIPFVILELSIFCFDASGYYWYLSIVKSSTKTKHIVIINE